MRSNGKVPPRALLQPPSPPLQTGKALSCQYPSLDTQMLWGLRNNWNLTNCPHAPAHFLLPVPPQQGEGEGKERHPDKWEKTQLNSKRGRKSTVTHSSKRLARRTMAPASSWNCTQPEFSCLQGLSQGHTKDQSWTAHGEHPAVCPSPHPAKGTP